MKELGSALVFGLLFAASSAFAQNSNVNGVLNPVTNGAKGDVDLLR